LAPQVLSSGELKEQGTPTELASRPDGTFARMVAAAAGSAAGSGIDGVAAGEAL
jgi:hypothetical protein